jgi:hypothetical protein
MISYSIICYVRGMIEKESYLRVQGFVHGCWHDARLGRLCERMEFQLREKAPNPRMMNDLKLTGNDQSNKQVTDDQKNRLFQENYRTINTTTPQHAHSCPQLQTRKPHTLS